ncbi:RUN and FYVE domain-containing protein, putative [Pediculus humanus corporis]|uniref:RUN and FYVE domain-containing protein, putative n=1 Tax=Pediculus humanus subsp. corporis TaxID=121224 RepID=E0VZD0_PEDHC|nr:RUN and FYVE domain-containing protein, putative [Pediculus humanus corporis]EEB18736.1 RUN and FYVE domain-containing protein, putative [Pediculus humanus corporis]
MLDQPQDMAGAQDTIYLCNFRVSVDGEWLCLKQLEDVEFVDNNYQQPISPPSPIEPLAVLAAKDPVLIERSNLVNISKLVVKELIETSQKYGRMLDSDHMPLQHFFIVLEHVLRHGLKPKKGLLGPKKELWDILQLVEKFTPEAHDITTSVRDLPTVSTHMGRARAWLRLALMQKKLADYLKVLIDRKDAVLADYFEPDALMMSDEAFIIIGLLVGLNVIDCNLCVKEEDLDCQQGVIDFSLYLRSSHHYYQTSDSILDPDNMTTVLDQKNYIEELNRHLNATVANLEAKVESLQTTNALMKEDLDISRNNIVLLTEENNQLKKQICITEKYMGGNTSSSSSEKTENRAGETSEDSNNKKTAEVKKIIETVTETEQLKKQLEVEKKKRAEAEKELKLQVGMKTEMEFAMKLLEKDIKEKENTISSLTSQLDEIKLINLELFKKLQECEEDLTQKGELVSRLQKKTTQIGKILNNMEKYNHLLRDVPPSRSSMSFDSSGLPPPTLPPSASSASASRPTSWGSSNSQTNDNIFDKKSPNYYKKVYPLTNVDLSKLKKSPKISEDVGDSVGGPTPSKLEKVSDDSGGGGGGGGGSGGGKNVFLQDCESSLKQKTELITKLEAKSVLITETYQKLEEKLEKDRLMAEELKEKLNQQLAEKKNLVTNTEEDLKVEREWRTSLQDSIVKDRILIEELKQELSGFKSLTGGSRRGKGKRLGGKRKRRGKLKIDLFIIIRMRFKFAPVKYETLKDDHEKLLKNHETIKSDYERLKEDYGQQELTLEELGVQLSVSRLKVADLEEEVKIKMESQWASDKEVQSCRNCTKEFNLTRRKHHCRNCGEIFCHTCSDNFTMLPSSGKPVRVCNECHVYLVSRNSVPSS